MSYLNKVSNNIEGQISLSYRMSPQGRKGCTSCAPLCRTDPYAPRRRTIWRRTRQPSALCTQAHVTYIVDMWGQVGAHTARRSRHDITEKELSRVEPCACKHGKPHTPGPYPHPRDTPQCDRPTQTALPVPPCVVRIRTHPDDGQSGAGRASFLRHACSHV